MNIETVEAALRGESPFMKSEITEMQQHNAEVNEAVMLKLLHLCQSDGLISPDATMAEFRTKVYDRDFMRQLSQRYILDTKREYVSQPNSKTHLTIRTTVNVTRNPRFGNNDSDEWASP